MTQINVLKAAERLQLGSDLALRHRYFVPASFAHPAKMNLALLHWITQRYTLPGDTIGDPMVGIGSSLMAAAWQRNVIAREIEPKWLTVAHENAARVLREAGLFAGSINLGQADAREPWGYEVDHVIFSPPYGCAFSKSKTAKGTLPQRLRRIKGGVSYTDCWQQAFASDAQGCQGFMMMHYGQHEGQIGHLRRDAYWEAMTQIYGRAKDALRAGGFMILVIKDHIKNGQRVETAAATVAVCQSLGFSLTEQHSRLVYPLSLWQRRRKEQGHPIVETEDVLVFTHAEATH